MPPNESLNSYAHPEHFSLDTVDDVTSVLGRNWFQAKIDLRRGYRSVPISPKNYTCAGLKWKFSGASDYSYLIDTRLVMGSSKAPSIFQRITSSVCRIMRSKGFICFVYLDDFYVCDKTYRLCKKAYDYLWKLLMSLGFTINEKKSVAPTQCLTFLGIEIDSTKLTLKIPDGKLNELKLELARWDKLKSASKRSLQKLLGKMNWAAKCVRAARPHMRRLIALLKGLNNRNHRVRLCAAAKQDIKWWSEFASRFNGVSVWSTNQTLPDHVTATDASLSGGAAAYAGDYLYANWTCDYPELRTESINVLEMFVILLALRKWSDTWKGSVVHVYTDSNVALYSITKGRMNSDIGMSIIREIHLIMASRSIYISLKRIDTKANNFADALSRLDNLQFAEKALAMLMNPELHKCRVVCNPLRHMSFKTWTYLLQLWRSRRRC